MVCWNNLKQISLALRNYQSDHHSLPPAYTVDASGKPLHSWRTLILPYLDEQALYNTIDLSKSWDDPANKQAFETKVTVYQCPSVTCPPNHTSYLAVSAPDSCLRPGEPRKLSDITDGQNTTLMVVDVDEQHCVPWMSPVDVSEQWLLSLAKVRGLPHAGGIHAAFADCSVQFLSSSLAPAKWRAMVSISGHDDGAPESSNRDVRSFPLGQFLARASSVVAMTAAPKEPESAAPAKPETDKRTEIARKMVSDMASGDFDKATESFDDTMKRVIPATKLKEVWDGVTKQVGPFQKATEDRTEAIRQYKAVFVTCEFQNGPLDVKVVFSPEGKITGLFFAPSGKYKRPPYVDAAKFDEENVSIGKGLLKLDGTLSLPKGSGPFPAIVLVHGSGPNDRDESIGPNKPFRDLAEGLASRGVAVLRYEKRTKQHQVLMAMAGSGITVKEETIDDAVSAVETLAGHEKIDPKRVFLLGHSLGGMLIPRIGKASNSIAGFVVLAGSTRPLEDLVLEQTKYIASLAGALSEEDQKKIRELEQQVARVKSSELSESTPGTELPFGAPPKYWLDLRGYQPAIEAESLRKPMLVLQGERDYQVTMEDFANWKKSLASRKDVKLQSYPNLNHLFMEGEGKSRPEEYAKPGNVAVGVIDDIAKWIDQTGR
jgi:dienelactone hydrolase